MSKPIHPNYQKIYQTVKKIPKGCVATYGQVAALAGMPGQARQVGYALHRCPDDQSIPWHRVLNAKGEISALPDPDSRTLQQILLEEEGIQFLASGKLNLKKYRWNP